jgi:hypothetical protein
MWYIWAKEFSVICGVVRRFFLLGLGLVLGAFAQANEEPSQQGRFDVFRFTQNFVDDSVQFGSDVSKQFSLARGSRTFPIPEGDPRLKSPRKVQLPKALQTTGRNGSRRPVVLVSVSGGGSRAAYYAACVMENLSRIKVQTPTGESSIMEEVGAISSVSGGGLAAGYYVLHFDRRNVSGFYPEFRRAMAANITWRTYGGAVIFPPAALQVAGPTVNRTDLLANQIEILLDRGPATFGDLLALENNAEDPAPALIVNGTVFNSGQRFVYTNIPTEFLPTIFPQRAHPVTNPTVETGFLKKLLEPVTPEQVGIDGTRIRLGTALASSAAFPVALAPIRLQTHPESIPPTLAGRGIRELVDSPFLHVADGGLHDNFGTDSLMSLARSFPAEQPVMVIIIDATLRSQTLKLGRSKVWYPWTSVLRMYDIGSLRGLGFAASLLEEVRPLGNHSTVLVKMAARDKDRQTFINRIPTAFTVSRGNRQLLEEIARENVNALIPMIRSEYARLVNEGHRSSRRSSRASGIRH